MVGVTHVEAFIMNIRVFAGTAALLFATFGPAAHAANLVTNGDFSATTYTQNNQFGTGYGGQGVTGWTGNGGYNLYFFAGTATTVSANSQYGGGLEKLYGPLPASPTGGNFVAIDGDLGAQGRISQSIAGLVVGQQYLLSFDWGAGQVQSRTGATTEEFSVSLGGETHTTSVVANPSASFTGWFHSTMTFTATNAIETLSFLSIGTPSGLPPIATLDGVSLTAVPEPAAFGLLGIGLLGLVAVRRRA
jgi:hypothetical protein